MKILSTTKINNWGDYRVDDTNAFLIRNGKEWKLHAGNVLSKDVYFDALECGWIATFKRKKDALHWLMFEEKLAESNGVEYAWKTYRIDCDICGDYHDKDSVPLSCATGDGE